MGGGLKRRTRCDMNAGNGAESAPAGPVGARLSACSGPAEGLGGPCARRSTVTCRPHRRAVATHPELAVPRPHALQRLVHGEVLRGAAASKQQQQQQQYSNYRRGRDPAVGQPRGKQAGWHRATQMSGWYGRFSPQSTRSACPGAAALARGGEALAVRHSTPAAHPTHDEEQGALVLVH